MHLQYRNELTIFYLTYTYHSISSKLAVFKTCFILVFLYFTLLCFSLLYLSLVYFSWRQLHYRDKMHLELRQEHCMCQPIQPMNCLLPGRTACYQGMEPFVSQLPWQLFTWQVLTGCYGVVMELRVSRTWLEHFPSLFKLQKQFLVTNAMCTTL